MTTADSLRAAKALIEDPSGTMISPISAVPRMTKSRQRLGGLNRWAKRVRKLHVDYETAKRLGQEFSAPVNRGLYLVSLTRAEYDELRERQ